MNVEVWLLYNNEWIGPFDNMAQVTSFVISNKISNYVVVQHKKEG